MTFESFFHRVPVTTGPVSLGFQGLRIVFYRGCVDPLREQKDRVLSKLRCARSISDFAAVLLPFTFISYVAAKFSSGEPRL